MTPKTFSERLLTRLLGLSILPAVVGCSLWAGTGSGADDAFEAGLARLEADDRADAVPALAVTARTCGMEPLGQQATLSLVTVELDPLYEDGSATRAARLSLHLLEHPERAPWTERMASVLYLLASDRRIRTNTLEPASVEELYPETTVRAGVDDCGARLAAGAADSITRPELPGLPTAVQRARLQERVERLEAEVERLQSLLEPPEPR